MRKPDGGTKAAVTSATDSGVRCTELATRTANNALPLAMSSWGTALDVVLKKTIHTLPLVYSHCIPNPYHIKTTHRYIEFIHNQTEVLGSDNYKDVSPPWLSNETFKEVGTYVVKNCGQFQRSDTPGPCPSSANGHTPHPPVAVTNFPEKPLGGSSEPLSAGGRRLAFDSPAGSPRGRLGTRPKPQKLQEHFRGERGHSGARAEQEALQERPTSLGPGVWVPCASEPEDSS